MGLTQCRSSGNYSTRRQINGALIDLLFCVGRISSTAVAVDPERDAHKQIARCDSSDSPSLVILSYYPTLMHINGKSVLHKR